MPSPAVPDKDVQKRSTVRDGTLLLTNVTKLVGLVIAVNEAVVRTELRPSALAVAVFMMAGAQFSESALLAIIDRFLGRER